VQTWDQLYIGGAWVEPAGSDRIDVHSPATLELVGSVPEATEADMDKAVAAGRRLMDSGAYLAMGPDARADSLQKLNELIGGRLDDFATTISNENGSPMLFSQMGQVGAAMLNLGTFDALTREFDWEVTRDGAMGGPVIVRHEPVGVVAGIVPWNVPLYLTINKLAMAIAAACPIVLKPAPETPLDGFMLAELVDQLGLPEGAVSILPAGREVGEHLVRHADIDKVSFTGSTAAGRAIGAICGNDLKRCTLELGGKSAAIMLEDADLDAVVPQLMMAGLMNNGQACVAQTRILVPMSREAEMNEVIAAAVAEQTVGDPLEMTTAVGPLVAERQRDRVEGYLQIGRDEGATVAVGGGRPEGFDTGWFVEPTLFTGVDNGMRIAQEEIFGPVLCSIPYETVDEAVRIANDSDYGLSGSVWTADAELGLDVARRVRTGTFNINTFAVDPVAPFGGFKHSGVGREFGPEGLAAFCELKTIAGA
jgi:betaine-aldehyde dehydrogenase